MSQELPAQQGSPLAPQLGLQVAALPEPTHSPPLVHVAPAQQASPVPPHGGPHSALPPSTMHCPPLVQVPTEEHEVAPLQKVLQHGAPAVPQLSHSP